MARIGAQSQGALDALLHRTRDPRDRRAVARLAAALGDRDGLARRLAPELARIAEGGAGTRLAGIAQEGTRGVILYRDATVTAMLVVVDADRSHDVTIGFGTGHRLTVFHASSPVTIERYRCAPGPGGRHGFEAGSAPPCRSVGRRSVAAGGGLMIEREREAFRIVEAAGPVPLVHVEWRGASPLPTRRYRWPSGDYQGMTMAAEADARAQVMVSALRTMARRDAAPALERVIASEVFTLRWHAMRAWLAIDAEAALPALVRMARGDRHREVRRAARAALRLVRPLAA